MAVRLRNASGSGKLKAILSGVSRWKRFSLRTLFALMTISSAVLGAWSVYVNPFRVQARSLADVYRLQGEAEFGAVEGPTWHRGLVVMLLGEDAFVHVIKVDLAGRNVDDRDVQLLSGLAHLQELCLDHTKVTDAGVTTLRGMRELVRLSLRYTAISDRSLQVLRAMPKLRKLTLTGTKLSDASVSDLAKMGTLGELYLRWTRISNAGARRLAEALPNCQVFHHALTAEAASTK